MIFELLLLIFLLFLLTLGGDCKRGEIATYLLHLQERAEAILLHAQVYPTPRFTLHATRDVPRTEQGQNIYLVLTRPDGEFYDDMTLIGVLCHELAHVVSGAGDEHGTEFEQWESDLLRAAQELGWYDDHVGMDATYPCFHET